MSKVEEECQATKRYIATFQLIFVWETWNQLYFALLFHEYEWGEFELYSLYFVFINWNFGGIVESKTLSIAIPDGKS